MPFELLITRPRHCTRSGNSPIRRPKPIMAQSRADEPPALHKDIWADEYYSSQRKNCLDYDKNDDAQDLLPFKKWWFMRDAEVVVNGKTLHGMAIFHWGDSIRVINKTHSYFIPLRHIDYIRTNDGYYSKD